MDQRKALKEKRDSGERSESRDQVSVTISQITADQKSSENRIGTRHPQFTGATP